MYVCMYVDMYVSMYVKKNHILRKAQILYTLVVNVSLVRASSEQSYAN